jgi:Ser/Thr protein kinase RdoA (MazF antagonist)
MRAFEDLTKRGKASRLRTLAINALEHYAFEVSDIRLIGLFTNAIFRLQSAEGKSYIIRVCRPGWRTTTDLRSEIMWLQDLAHNTDIGAPEPQPTRDDEPYVVVRAEGVPEGRRCVVMSWIPGVQLGSRLSEANLYRMGVLFARLHKHAVCFSPPDGFTLRKMDRVLARDEEDALFSPTNACAFTPRARKALERTREAVSAEFQRLYANPTGLRVIHNDLWHGNIQVYHSRLRPLDFEDTIWGYPVQDVAMALQDLMVDVERDAYEPLQAAFRQGYESMCTWPERYAGQIDTFRAGRMLWVANYVARYERQYLGEHIDWLAGEFERFLTTGTIRKQ